MNIESHRIEFKRQLTDGLEKEAVAFLNYRDGGVIYIGMDDDGARVGVDDVDGLQLIIKDRLKHNITPSTMGLFDVTVDDEGAKPVIEITLVSGSEKPYYLSKRGMSPKGYSVPQNKELMRIFRDLDMVEQLGSGIPRILAHYPQSIYQFSPNFIRLVLPYAEGFEAITMQAPRKHPASTPQATDQASDQADRLIEYCSKARYMTEITNYLGLKHRTYFRRNILKPLLDTGRLVLTIPDKPKSPNQQYVAVKNQVENDG